MKFILFLMLQTGAAPITPEHYLITTAEFDDRASCEYAGNEFRKVRQFRVTHVCAPKGIPAAAIKPPADEVKP